MCRYVLICVDIHHHQGIANRDIKLENTLLNSNYETALRTSQRFPIMKLCDFGYSKVQCIACSACNQHVVSTISTLSALSNVSNVCDVLSTVCTPPCVLVHSCVAAPQNIS